MANVDEFLFRELLAPLDMAEGPKQLSRSRPFRGHHFFGEQLAQGFVFRLGHVQLLTPNEK